MNLYKYKLLQYYSAKEYDVYNNPIIANGFNNDIEKSCLKIKIPQHILGSDVSDDDLGDYLSYNINIQSDSLNDYTFYAIGTPTVGGTSSAWTRYNKKNGIDIKIGSQHADTIIYIISDSSNNQSYLYPINISYKYNISNSDISKLSSNIQSKWKAYFPWEFHNDKDTIISNRTLYFNDGSTKYLGKYINYETFKSEDYGYSIGTNLYTSIQVFGQYESLNYILRKMPDDDNLYDYSGRHITFNGTNITNINGLSIDINQYYDKEGHYQSNDSWFNPVFEGSCITSLPYLGTVHNYISTSSDGKTTIINNNYSVDNGISSGNNIPLRFGAGSHRFNDPGLAVAFKDCDLLSMNPDNAFPLPWYGIMKTTENNEEYSINQLTMGSGTFSGCFYDCENLNNIYLKFYNFTNIPTSELTNDEYINLAFDSGSIKTSTGSIGYTLAVNSIDRLLSCFNDSNFNKFADGTYKNKIEVSLIDFPVPIKTYNANGYTYYDPNSPAWKTYYNYLCNLTYSGGTGARYSTPSLNFIYKDSNGIEKRTEFITNYKPYKPGALSQIANEIKYWLLYLELYFDFNQNNFEVDYTQPIDYERFKDFNIIIPNITDLKYTYTTNGIEQSTISDHLSEYEWDYLLESKLINVTINDNKYYLTTREINAVNTNNENITLTILGFNINNKFYALNTNRFTSENTTPNNYAIDFEKLKANCNKYITVGEQYSASNAWYVKKTNNGYKAYKVGGERPSYVFDSKGISSLGCTCID